MTYSRSFEGLNVTYAREIFHRIEQYDLVGPNHGTDGHVPVELASKQGTTDAFFASVVNSGSNVVGDTDGARLSLICLTRKGEHQEGFYYLRHTAKLARRQDAYTAYVLPVRDAPNLTIRTRALVQRVLFTTDSNATRAIGVRYTDLASGIDYEVAIIISFYYMLTHSFT